MKLESILALPLVASFALFGQSLCHAAEEDVFAAGEDDATGTDPRAFGPKFMPYYRYTELENNVKQQEVVAFGLTRFSERAALTYEIPLAMKRDVRGTPLRNPSTGECGGSLAGGPRSYPTAPWRKVTARKRGSAT